MRNGLEDFRSAVEARDFPNDEESYHMPAGVVFELAGTGHNGRGGR